MPSRDTLIRYRATFDRFAFIPLALVGIFLLSLGYVWGGTRLMLILKGHHIDAQIVAYEEVTLTHRGRFRAPPRGRSTSLRIVEFQTQGQTYRFRDGLGTSIRHRTPKSTVVLFNPEDPQQAMIDHGYKNWIPWGLLMWGGIFCLGLAFSGCVRLFRRL